MPEPEDGEQQYEVDYTIRDTTLIWASSAGAARSKAEGMGYAEITGVREADDGPQ